MNKIWLIIKREYLTRVMKKTFILSTFLTPLLFAGIIFFVIFISVKNVQEEKIAVRDTNGFFKDKLESSKEMQFVFTDTVDKNNLRKSDYTAVLYVPNAVEKGGKDNFELYSRKSLAMATRSRVENQVRTAIENYMLDSLYNINLVTLDSVRKISHGTRIEQKIVEEDNKIAEGNAGVAQWIGYGAAFLIYITLFVYGAMVMRGVSEEKTNRIAEVMVSSVKPFQLMIGKIVGIGAVGLTQFLLWIILMTGFSMIITATIPAEVMQAAQAGGAPMPGMQFSQATMGIAKASVTLGTVNWFVTIGLFLFYFLFGYLFYAALFAAVGSAVNEDPQDAQSLMFPITMPIVIAIIIMINAITNPSSSLAVWSSIIPFFSPVVMMARIPFGIPSTVAYWELGLSMLSLIGGFLFTTWLSAKIYRTGILMYGKKATWKEMMKWAFRKN
jgi:ABC-2 type transport system permease protein